MRQSIIFFVLIMFITCAFAQSNDKKIDSPADSTVTSSKKYRNAERKDLRDVIHALFKRRHSSSHPVIQPDSGFAIQPFLHPVIRPDSIKIKPGKLLFAPFPVIGYALQTGITAIVSMNLSFYTGNSDSTNLSTIAINPTRSLSHSQFLFPVIFNIWSNKNKMDFLGDWRYYKYPTYTYGLGGHTQLGDADLINYSYIRAYETALRRIAENFYGGAGYNFDYHYDIREEGNGTDFQPYNGNHTKTVSSGVSLNLIYDSRKNTNYPINAFYSNLVYRSNFTYLGSDQNWQALQLEFKKFIKLFPHSNNVLAFWNLNWFTFGKTPYFDLPSTGWDSYSNTGRGYIQGRLRGPGMIYVESEYRFGITPNGLFGAVVFANAQSVAELGGGKFETILPGTGLGLRIKINKISGANLAIDYGFGKGGSQGLFFNISEVF